MYKLNGRNVVSIQLAGVDSKDAPEFCDAYIESAKWENTGENLNEEDLELINDDGDLINELACEQLQCQADSLNDLMNGR